MRKNRESPKEKKEFVLAPSHLLSRCRCGCGVVVVSVSRRCLAGVLHVSHARAFGDFLVASFLVLVHAAGASVRCIAGPVSERLRALVAVIGGLLSIAARRTHVRPDRDWSVVRYEELVATSVVWVSTASKDEVLQWREAVGTTVLLLRAAAAHFVIVLAVLTVHGSSVVVQRRSCGRRRLGPVHSRHCVLMLEQFLCVPALRVGDAAVAVVRRLVKRNELFSARFAVVLLRHSEATRGTGGVVVQRPVLGHQKVELALDTHHAGEVLQGSEACDARVVLGQQPGRAHLVGMRAVHASHLAHRFRIIQRRGSGFRCCVVLFLLPLLEQLVRVMHMGYHATVAQVWWLCTNTRSVVQLLATLGAVVLWRHTVAAHGTNGGRLAVVLILGRQIRELAVGALGHLGVAERADAAWARDIVLQNSHVHLELQVAPGAGHVFSIHRWPTLVSSFKALHQAIV